MSAEKSECVQRIERWAKQERLEAEKRQVTTGMDKLNTNCDTL